MMTPIIKMQKMGKVYSTGDMLTHALIDIDLEINAGDYFSISGPSGCGKSTLLSLMGLLDFPTSGRLEINGEDVTNLSLQRAAGIRNEQIGIVFQQFNLIDELTVFDNIALPLRYASNKVSNQQIADRVHGLLDTVGMTTKTNQSPKKLSGGEQQRIAIARALVNNPEILLVDEPTGNLDSKNAENIMSIFGKLNQTGMTVCLVTHDPRFADMAQQKVYLLDGQVLGRSD